MINVIHQTKKAASEIHNESITLKLRIDNFVLSCSNCVGPSRNQAHGVGNLM